MEKGLISVIMATFNEPSAYISQTIESILHQTYSDIELLIADDSKSAETIATIDKYAALDRRVKVIRKPEKMGFVKALNIALKEAKGEFVARMDGDDVAYLDRFEKQMGYLSSHPEVDVLGGAIDIIDANDKVVSHRNYPHSGCKMVLWMTFRDPVAHPTIVMKRKVIDEGNYYDETMNKGCEDTEMWLRLRRKGYKIDNVEDSVLKYRIAVDMADKRARDNWPNIIARKKNISFKYFVFDILSIFVLLIRTYMPKSLVTKAYNRENGQKF